MKAKKSKIHARASRSRPAVPKFDDSWSPEVKKPSKKEETVLSKAISKKKKSKARKQKEEVPDVNLDLIGQLFEEKIGKMMEETGKNVEKKKKIKISYAEEYDPARPNDYHKLDKERKELKEKQDLKKLESRVKKVEHKHVQHSTLEITPAWGVSPGNTQHLPGMPPLLGMPSVNTVNRMPILHPPVPPMSGLFPGMTLIPPPLPPGAPPLPLQNIPLPETPAPMPPPPAEQPLESNLFPTVDEKVIRMMRNSGWKVGQALGSEGQGMKTPLIAFKTNANSGIIQNSAVEVEDLLDDKTKTNLLNEQYQKDLPISTNIVKMTNLLTPEEFSPVIQQDIQLECMEFGNFQRMAHSVDNSKEKDDLTALTIFAVYSNNSSATMCKVKMDNRYFGDRRVKAEFVTEDVIKNIQNYILKFE